MFRSECWEAKAGARVEREQDQGPREKARLELARPQEDIQWPEW